jgi:cytochrome P450
LKRTITTIEPENAKTTLVSKFKDYGIGHRLERLGPLVGAGIFTTDGEHWAMSRALIRPSFARDQVASLRQFEELIPGLFALIPRDGMTTVDLQDVFFRYAIDSTTKFLFGQSVGSLKLSTKSESNLAYAFNYAQEAIKMRKVLGPLSRFYRDPKADECNKICRDFVQQFVNEAICAVELDKDVKRKQILPNNFESKHQKYIFSHELARQTSDKRRILDELMNVLLAGRDTTASLLSNMFFMLAKHPGVWKKLREEVATLNCRVPTRKDLRNLVYLKSCISECKYHETQVAVLHSEL